MAQYSESLDPVSIKSLEESFDRIENGLGAKIPQLAANFKSFRKDLFNEKDFSKAHIWEKAPYGLVDLKDESIVVLLPENCREGEKVNIVQAVVRMPPKVTGMPENKITFKYVEKVVNELKNTNPVQLSFLLVHEWLWSFSRNVERNRRINYWIHSDALEKNSKEEWIKNLHSLGFVIPDLQPPVWENSICEFDQKTAERFWRFRGNNVRIAVFEAQGEIFKRKTKCPRNGSCVEQKYTDETATFRRSFDGPLKVKGLIMNFLAALRVYQPKGEEEITSKNTHLGACDIIDGSKQVLCRNEYNGKEFNFRTILGDGCAIFRGQSVVESGSYNEIEEIVFYFPRLEWLVQ